MPDTSLTHSKNNKALWLCLACITLLIIIDQWFKVHIKTTMQLHTEVDVLGEWFRLHFTENPGMAFGLKLEFLGRFGKVALTLFRLIAVVFGFFILVSQAKKGAHRGLLLCIALILAGAIGNLVDSIFYGVVFSDINQYIGGYFHGHVVDMLYFPIVQGHYWDWIPKLGGESFTFFSPVFNLADSFISTGAIAIFVFQKYFFKKDLLENNEDIIAETNAPDTSSTVEFSSLENDSQDQTDPEDTTAP